jgi:antirestriction protein ArdC
LRVLKNDKKAIFGAAANASQASTSLLAHEDGAA